MQILFLGREDMLDPFYYDFLIAIDGRYPVALFDTSKDLTEQFQGVDVVIDFGGMMATPMMIDAAVAAGARLWQELTTGIDHIDVSYFFQKGLPLANTPGPASAIAVAEHALFLMLCIEKNFQTSQQNIRSGVMSLPMNQELCGQTLGLVGLGASGRELAKRAVSLGMRIIAIDVLEIEKQVLDELRVEFFGGAEDLDRILMEADYVSLHTSLNSTTRNMIDERRIGLMKPSAVLINTARGAIVDEDALVEALRTGRIRAAGLDTFVREPLEPTHPLLALENVVLTPHIAGVTRETSRRRAEMAAENVARIASGMPRLYEITAVDGACGHPGSR